MKKLFIKRNLVQDLSKEAVVCYLCIQDLLPSMDDKIVLTYKTIILNLLRKRGNDYFYSSIKKGMNELIDKKIIQTEETNYKEHILIKTNVSEYKKNKNYYYCIYSEELRKIFRSNSKLNKFSTVIYLLMLIQTFNGCECTKEYRYRIGYMPKSHINKLAGLSEPTGDKHYKLLEELKILYVIRHYQTYQIKSKSGAYVTEHFTNTYSRYEDKALCIKYDREVRQIKSSTTSMSNDTNYSRSIIQKYNQLLKGREYDQTTLREIYEGIKDWNKRKKEWYEDEILSGNSPAVPEYKDLSVFEKYCINTKLQKEA